MSAAVTNVLLTPTCKFSNDYFDWLGVKNGKLCLQEWAEACAGSIEAGSSKHRFLRQRLNLRKDATILKTKTTQEIISITSDHRYVIKFSVIDIDICLFELQMANLKRQKCD